MVGVHRLVGVGREDKGNLTSIYTREAKSEQRKARDPKGLGKAGTRGTNTLLWLQDFGKIFRCAIAALLTPLIEYYHLKRSAKGERTL